MLRLLDCLFLEKAFRLDFPLLLGLKNGYTLIENRKCGGGIFQKCLVSSVSLPDNFREEKQGMVKEFRIDSSEA